MVKWGVSITAFNEPWIEQIINQYKPLTDRIVVAVSSKPWYGKIKADDTYERAKKTGVLVSNGYWDKECDQRNYTLNLLRDCDYVIASHCDTFFTKDDLQRLKRAKLTELHYATRTLTYWKDFDTVIDPDVTLPTIIVRSDAVYNHMINIENQTAVPKTLPITCYHLSWAKPAKSIKTKLASYSHADEIDKKWYNDVYMKDKATNLAPTVASDYQGLRKDPLPKEIRDLL